MGWAENHASGEGERKQVPWDMARCSWVRDKPDTQTTSTHLGLEVPQTSFNPSCPNSASAVLSPVVRGHATTREFHRMSFRSLAP